MLSSSSQLPSILSNTPVTGFNRCHTKSPSSHDLVYQQTTTNLVTSSEPVSQWVTQLLNINGRPFTIAILRPLKLTSPQVRHATTRFALRVISLFPHLINIDSPHFRYRSGIRGLSSAGTEQEVGRIVVNKEKEATILSSLLRDPERSP